jgi:hypothetical protein
MAGMEGVVQFGVQDTMKLMVAWLQRQAKDP